METLIDITAIGRRIVSLRKEHEMSRDKLAEKIGVSVDFLGRVERGGKSFSLENYAQIAKLFSVSLDYLLLGDVKTDFNKQMKDLCDRATPEKQKLVMSFLRLLDEYDNQ